MVSVSNLWGGGACLTSASWHAFFLFLFCFLLFPPHPSPPQPLPSRMVYRCVVSTSIKPFQSWSKMGILNLEAVCLSVSLPTNAHNPTCIFMTSLFDKCSYKIMWKYLCIYPSPFMLILNPRILFLLFESCSMKACVF